jgi:hypothetical protein
MNGQQHSSVAHLINLANDIGDFFQYPVAR